MTFPHLLTLVVVAGLVTPPLVLLIPRARQSPAFDRLLWVGTFLIAFFGAWLAPAYVGPVVPGVAVSDEPILPILIGAIAGALSLHLPLWLLDRLEKPVEDEDDTSE